MADSFDVIVIGGGPGGYVAAIRAAQFAVTLGLLAVSGTFFYFMVKAMARIQMPERK